MAAQIIPALRYDDAPGAIDWLERVLGFQRGSVYGDGDRVDHAQLRLGDEWIMLGSTGRHAGEDLGSSSTSTYIATDDVDALHERAKAAGAEFVRELEDTDYGSHEFGVRDPGGNRWSVGTYRPGG